MYMYRERIRKKKQERKRELIYLVIMSHITVFDKNVLTQQRSISQQRKLFCNYEVYRVITQEPIMVEGMLAICPRCGYSSLYFNRCERCNAKLSEEVKSIPIAQKECGISVDVRIMIATLEDRYYITLNGTILTPVM